VSRLPDAAFALGEAAVRLAQRGDADDARDALERAAAAYDAMGAVLDLQRIQARLRPFAIRRGSRSPHRRLVSGWQALTSSERLVAERVMRGESNPEIAGHLFVSRRTVETHVSHILRKLRVRGRADIVREAERHLSHGHDLGEPSRPVRHG